MPDPKTIPYDPLTATGPGAGLPLPDSYWAATAGPQPEDDGVFQTDREVDVAIVGGGYTGLSAAYHLAQNHGAAVAVLEAHVPGWGCSGRNGGSVRPGIGRVPLRKWIEHWGAENAHALFEEQLAAVRTLRTLIADGNIDCDVQDEGTLRVAHNPGSVAGLDSDHRLMTETFGYGAELLDANEIEQNYFRSSEAYGALKFPDGLGVHPLKLGQGVLRMARGAGASVYRSSPVLGWQSDDDGFVVQTSGAGLRAKHIIIATNGYTGDALHPSLKHRTLPVLSNIMVTRPMTSEEKAATNFISTAPVSDTRHVLFYYRRLPDDRLMIGGRGPINERAAGAPKWKDNLLNAVAKKFPALSSLSLDYYWAGWVCLPYDSSPHVHHLDEFPNVWFSLGYCGIGVAPALHFGSLLAERIGGDKAIPQALARPIPQFPMARFRRLGQRAMYAWYQIKDG